MGKVIVKVNGIVVGSVSTDELCQMKKEACKDLRIWVNSVMNLLEVFFKLSKICVNVLVAGIVVGALFLALNEPTAFSDMLQAMTTTPEIVKANALIVWRVWIAFSFVFLALTFFVSWRSLGLKDYLAEGLATKLRMKLNVPAVGEVSWHSEIQPGSTGGVTHAEILLETK